MIMENTQFNKEKFFAQYFGQRLWRCDRHEKYYPVDYEVMAHIEEDGQWLHLKSLSSITDEDAIEVAKILTGYDEPKLERLDNDSWYVILQGGFSKCHLWFDGEIVFDSEQETNQSLLILNAYELLRSRGYALPYLGTSVEKLIEYGWVKLI